MAVRIRKKQYKYILEIIYHFSEWYFKYLLKTIKRRRNFKKKIIETKLLKTDDGEEFKNNIYKIL